MPDNSDKPAGRISQASRRAPQVDLESIRRLHLEQRVLALEKRVQAVEREFQGLERDAANLYRVKIVSILQNLHYLRAMVDQLSKRHDDYRSALEMLQSKSENLRGDTAETERRLLDRIATDAKDRRSLMLALGTAVFGAVTSLIYALFSSDH